MSSALFKAKRLQSGISLVEILVSLVISIFLLGGIIQVYLGNTSTYKFVNALSEVQENGRFAIETMTQDLRAAGDWGCINFNPLNVAVIDNTTIKNINNTLIPAVGVIDPMFDFITNPPISGTNNAGGLGTSDTLTINGSVPGQINITSDFSTPADSFINVNRLNSFTEGDIAIITRCGPNDKLPLAEADIFRVASVVSDSNRINHATVLSQQYENDAVIKRLQNVVYSIENNAVNQPSLYRSFFGNNEELVSGVEDMQILYGVDTNNDTYTNHYVSNKVFR